MRHALTAHPQYKIRASLLAVAAAACICWLVFPTLDALIRVCKAFEQLFGALRIEPCVSKLQPRIVAVTVRTGEVIKNSWRGMILASVGFKRPRLVWSLPRQSQRTSFGGGEGGYNGRIKIFRQAMTAHTPKIYFS